MLIEGHKTISKIREYFNKRNNIVIQQKDNTSIVWHWHLAGLPIESIVTEAIHNIIAFSQFNNVIYLLICDLLNKNIPNPITYNFFQKYSDISGNHDNDKERLNIVREIYRLLVPNSASLSRIIQSKSDTIHPIQGRDIHKLIMIDNTTKPSWATNIPSQIPGYLFIIMIFIFLQKMLIIIKIIMILIQIFLNQNVITHPNQNLQLYISHQIYLLIVQ